MFHINRAVVAILPILALGACYKYSSSQSKDPKSEIVYSMDRALGQENVVPVVIIGSGPAGLSAALYISRAGMKSFVFAGPMPRGQLTQTSMVENWPGKEQILGFELMKDIQKQAESFGATVIYDTIKSLDTSVWPFSLVTEEGRKFKALAVIIATGATPRKLGVPGEQEYWGKGVTTCAICDAAFFGGKNVVISGGGDSAVEMAFELSPHVKHVTLLVRKDTMRASAVMQQKLPEMKNVSVEYNKEIHEIYGNGKTVTGIEVFDNKSKTSQKRSIDGVFLAIGHEPNNQILQGSSVAMDEHGYLIMQDRSQETSVKGVFAAGEIQDPFYRQAIVASGEGVRAALDVSSFLYDIGYNVEAGKKLEEFFFENFTEHAVAPIKELSSVQDLHKLVLKASGTVVLDFYSTTCPCCLQMLPHIAAVANKLQGKISVYKILMDSNRNPIYRELNDKFGIAIQKLPTMMIFKDGKMVDTNTRVMNRSEIYQYFSKFCEK